MITVHHLNNSRSQRILWLLEEIGEPYEIKFYQRGSPVPLAPPELKAVHPLGKSPVVTVDGKTIAESGAIIELLIERFAADRLAPKRGTEAYVDYIHWLHFAEGSAMLPLMLKLYTGMLGEGAAPLAPRIDSEIANHLSYMECALAGRDYFVGDSITGADIQLSFVSEAANGRGVLSAYPNIARHLTAMQKRPAYRRALDKGGPYAYGPKD
jgi:glutathione S-transferase